MLSNIVYLIQIICPQLYDLKYFYLYTVMQIQLFLLFQVFLPNSNNL